MAGQDEATVKEIFRNRSPKGVTALTWKAGMSADTAVQLQQRMARIGPSDVLKPKAKNAFPMTGDDMTFQLEYFAEMAEKAKNP